jgi:GH25 family lysozyme M1 (1,4-beta-N-acetylmuramidase)
MANGVGRDYSHWQDDSEVQFHSDLNSGIEFVGLKVSQGTGYVDPTLSDRLPRVRTVPFKAVLLYHFFDPKADPQWQANHFANALKALGPLQANERIAVDLESTPGWEDLDPQASVDSVVEFVSRAKAALGLLDTDVFIYESQGWARGQFGDELQRLTHWKLWVARYEVPEPGDVSPWDDWTIWQYNEHGGPRKDLDLDQWNGPVNLS